MATYETKYFNLAKDWSVPYSDELRTWAISCEAAGVPLKKETYIATQIAIQQERERRDRVNRIFIGGKQD